MNITMLPPKRITLLLLMLTLSSPAWAASDAAHYRNCLATSGIDPARALTDAMQWARAGGGTPAGHCEALALVGLKRYAQAGAKLDALAAARDVPDSAFRAQLFDQAGNAWLLAGDGAHAVQSLTSALTLSAGDADLFADLARAQAMRKNWPEVVLDLNAALQSSPRRTDLLVLRASAHRALKQFQPALTDIDAALKLRPGDGDALGERALLKRELGDLAGARRDFESVIRSQPQSPAGAAARDNLDSLN